MGIQFANAVKRMVGPALEARGFAWQPSRPSTVSFERRYRGYPNQILFEEDRRSKALGLHGFRFILYAPKEPSGLDSTHLARGKWWGYESEEELERRLEQATVLLLTEGMDWLDTYTPGNVPNWEDYLGELCALIAAKGFAYKVPVPDMPSFEGANGSITIDLRVPGQIRPYAIRWRPSPLVEKAGPLLTYTSAGELSTQFFAVKAFVMNEALGLFLE